MLEEYLVAASGAGFAEVRIIHDRGRGVQACGVEKDSAQSLFALRRLASLHVGVLDRKHVGHARPHLHNPYLAPSTPVQEKMARIWAELLGIEKVGIQDNFFDLGSHSLLAIQVVTRVKSELGAEISVATLFEGPTVESLCRLIGPPEGEAASGFEQSSDRGRRRKAERLRRSAEAAQEQA